MSLSLSGALTNAALGTWYASTGIGGQPATDESHAPQVCIANIGPRQRRRRLVFGQRMLAVGALATMALLVVHADLWWRLGLFVPFVMGAAGVFQATDHT